MMNGITVLDASTKIVEHTWGWSWGAFALILLGVLCIVISILCEGNGIAGDFFFIVGIISITVSLILFSRAKPAKIIPTYMVTIDSSVSLVEFYDKYEILDIQGKIYTIVEKEDINE